MPGKVSTASLVDYGLAAMERIGKPALKLPKTGNAKIFRLANGETVRVRTCNRHVLLVNAKHPDPDAKLDIEGTDWILVVMPKEEFTAGEYIAYLIPALEGVSEMRKAHRKWRATNPATKGRNMTWTLAFKELPAHDNYAVTWAKYQIL
jgi:hypothetical protein